MEDDDEFEPVPIVELDEALEYLHEHGLFDEDYYE